MIEIFKDKLFWKVFGILLVIGGILYFSIIYILIPAYLSTNYTHGKRIGNAPVLGYYNASNDTIVVLTDDVKLGKHIYKHEMCHRDYYLKSDDVGHKAGLWEEIVCYTKGIW